HLRRSADRRRRDRRRKARRRDRRDQARAHLLFVQGRPHAAPGGDALDGAHDRRGQAEGRKGAGAARTRMTTRLDPVSYTSADGETEIPSYMATPDGDGPHPTVLILRG